MDRRRAEPKSLSGYCDEDKKPTPAGNRAPDWRAEESRIDTRYDRGSARIQHPINWVLAAE